jgi:hypothetical protein
VAVIDESTKKTDAYHTQKWDEFRAAYPKRPFCLLRPFEVGGEKLFLPPKFVADPDVKFYNITQEDAKQPVVPRSPLQNWYTLCDIGSFAATGINFVGLFIDTSGSMTAATVKVMTETFITNLTSAGLKYKTLLNMDEDWILPFIAELSTL